MIDFNETRTPYAFLLVNICKDGLWKKYMGECEIRVGDDDARFSTNRAIVKSNVVEGGLFDLDPASGRYISMRRNGANPQQCNGRLPINEIRIYESINLLSKYSGRVALTADTSAPTNSNFKAENLL